MYIFNNTKLLQHFEVIRCSFLRLMTLETMRSELFKIYKIKKRPDEGRFFYNEVWISQ